MVSAAASELEKLFKELNNSKEVSQSNLENFYRLVTQGYLDIPFHMIEFLTRQLKRPIDGDEGRRLRSELVETKCTTVLPNAAVTSKIKMKKAEEALKQELDELRVELPVCLLHMALQPHRPSLVKLKAKDELVDYIIQNVVKR
jgi:hypothetical protein